MSFDTERIFDLDTDSMKGLYVLMGIVNDKAERFRLYAHSNSAVITKEENATDVTSYIVGVFEKGAAAEAKATTVLFYPDLYEHEGADVPRILMGNDVVVTTETELKEFVAKRGYVWDEYLQKYFVCYNDPACSIGILGIVYTPEGPHYSLFPHDIIQPK
jgi:hypothetical protein